MLQTQDWLHVWSSAVDVRSAALSASSDDYASTPIHPQQLTDGCAPQATIQGALGSLPLTLIQVLTKAIA